MGLYATRLRNKEVVTYTLDLWYKVRTHSRLCDAQTHLRPPPPP